MHLYMAAGKETAKAVVASGFEGSWLPVVYGEAEDSLGESMECCEFLSQPPPGFTVTRTDERVRLRSEGDGDDERIVVAISGRETVVHDVDALVMEIEIPDEEVRRYASRDTPSPEFPSVRFLIPADLANRYLPTLRLYRSHDGREVGLGR